jgi:hypothetical protein
MRSQTAIRTIGNEYREDNRKPIHCSCGECKACYRRREAQAYLLGYRDGRRDEKHSPGDRVLRMFNSYSS